MKCRKCNGVGWIKTTSARLDEVEYDRYKMCECQKQENKEENDYKPSKAEWWKKYERRNDE